MEESETTENEHAVSKAVASVTKVKQKKKLVGNVHLLKENQEQILTLKHRKKWWQI